MGFLTEEDYSVQIRTEIKAVINQSNNSQEIAELTAEAEMVTYLKPAGYDVAAIFAAEGASRHKSIIKYMIDLVIYDLHSAIVTRAMPKTREDRFNAAMTWLSKVNSGALVPDLPRTADAAGDSTPKIKLGSNPKYSKRY